MPDPQNPQNLNRYSYVRNSPPNFIDPSGHIGIVPLIGLIAAGVALLTLTSDVAPPPDSPVAHSRMGNQVVGEYAFVVALTSGVGILAAPAASGPVAATTAAELLTLELADGDDDEVRLAQQVGNAAAKAEQYLAQLQQEGDRAVVRRGQISARTMSMMSEATEGTEFGLFRSTDGLRYLIRGTTDRVTFPADTARVIAHVHPGTGPVGPSWADTAILDPKCGLVPHQQWSIVFNSELQAVRYYQRLYSANSPATMDEMWEQFLQWAQNQ